MLADADDNADRAPATLPAVLIPVTEDDAPADELSSVMSAMMMMMGRVLVVVVCCYLLVGVGGWVAYVFLGVFVSCCVLPGRGAGRRIFQRHFFQKTLKMWSPGDNFLVVSLILSLLLEKSGQKRSPTTTF